MTTNNTTTLAQPASVVAALGAADIVTSLLQRLGSLLRMPAPGVPEATAQLLRMAAAYETSQPSYAADLRAAASMAEREAA